MRVPGRIGAAVATVAWALAPFPVHAQAGQIRIAQSAGPRTVTAPVAAPSAQPYPAYLALRINGQSAGAALLVWRAGESGFYLSEKDAGALRLALKRFAAPANFDAERHYPVHGIAGIEVAFDEATQTLALTVAALVFERASMDLVSGPRTMATRPDPGSFLSYDLFAQRASSGDPRASAGGQLEWGVFMPAGVLVNSLLGTRAGSAGKVTRLDSAFNIDLPDSMASWRIGDGITRTATWGNPSRFAGVQYATNFSTQPAIITYPLAALSGQTSLPSVVDVYVNNVLAASRNVPAGPFTLNELPGINGQGEIRLQVRDLLGREQTVTAAAYGSTALLRAGLDDVAFQAGTFRERYGLRSADYGRGFASGFWRRGVSDTVTVHGAAELARGQLAGGAGATWLMGSIGEFSASAAASHQSADSVATASSLFAASILPTPGLSDAGARNGRAWTLGWNRRTQNWSIGGLARMASPGFRSLSDLGALADVAPPRRELSAFASIGTSAGSFAMGYAALTRPAANLTLERSELLQLAWSIGVRRLGFFSVNAFANLQGTRDRSVVLAYTLPLDPFTQAGASSSVTRGAAGQQTENRVNLQRSLPTADGFGYRLDVSDQRRAIANLQAQNRSGTYGLELARLAGSTAGRLSAAGSLIYMGGELNAGRRVEDAFALVRVPDFPGVRVYLDNQEVGRTNGRGNLFVPRLQPYQVNRLSIEQLDLPLSAEVMSLKQETTPYLKSGVVVRFPVKETQGGMIRLIDAATRPIAAGAVVTNLDTGEAFPVARDGEAFITGLSAISRIRVSLRDKSCTIEFTYKRSADPQPRLGTFTCKLKP